MKIQDILFFLIISFLLYKKNSKWLTAAGMVSLVFSIPLFASWTFFTAERLTWYAAAFFILAIIFQLWQLKKHER